MVTRRSFVAAGIAVAGGGLVGHARDGALTPAEPNIEVKKGAGTFDSALAGA
jgi:hypothetical protein